MFITFLIFLAIAAVFEDLRVSSINVDVDVDVEGGSVGTQVRRSIVVNPDLSVQIDQPPKAWSALLELGPLRVWRHNMCSSPISFTPTPCELCTAGVQPLASALVSIFIHNASIPILQGSTTIGNTFRIPHSTKCVQTCAKELNGIPRDDIELVTSFTSPSIPGREFPLILRESTDVDAAIRSTLQKMVGNSIPGDDLVAAGRNLIEEQKSLRRYRRQQLQERIESSRSAAVSLLLGASPEEMEQDLSPLIPTDVNTLDITSPYDWPVPPRSVSYMIAEHVWEHLPLLSAISAAVNCREKLIPGGIIIVAVPSYPQDNSADMRDDHLVKYDERLLTSVFLSAGFLPSDIRSIDPAPCHLLHHIKRRSPKSLILEITNSPHSLIRELREHPTQKGVIEALADRLQPAAAVRELQRFAVLTESYDDPEILGRLSSLATRISRCAFDGIEVRRTGSRVFVDRTCDSQAVTVCSVVEPGHQFANCEDNFELRKDTEGRKLITTSYDRKNKMISTVTTSLSSLSEDSKTYETSGPATSASMPIIFFTIVLNGMPYIEHHMPTFLETGIPFSWHVVEGVASGRADSRRPYSNEPISTPKNLSTDGTSEYLDYLDDKYENVHIYRRSPSAYSDKLQMVNEVLSNLPSTPAVLFQVDTDEIWSPSMIKSMHRLLSTGQKSCAYAHCHFFVGPDLVAVTPGGWGHGENEWLRAWRYHPPGIFLSHAPPVLIHAAGGGDCFSTSELAAEGIAFSHYAYVHEGQARFKSKFYGYGENGVDGWRNLQQAKLPARAADYLPWLNDANDPRLSTTMVDHFSKTDIAPTVPQVHPVKDKWQQTESAGEESICETKVVVDSVTFQMKKYAGGISRVWSEVLPRLPKYLSTQSCISILVRGGAFNDALPLLPNVEYLSVPVYNEDGDYGRDELMLSSFDADVFISTQYTCPRGNVTCLLLMHDVTPELLGWTGSYWMQKRHIVSTRASAIVAVSETTKSRVKDIYEKDAIGSGNGVDTNVFYRRQTRRRVAVDEPYVLMVGERRGYKSGHCVIQTLKLAGKEAPLLVMVGGGELTEDEAEILQGVRHVWVGRVDDDALAEYYSSAIALMYLSIDEGFGLPIVEAMACGCGVVASDIEVHREVTGARQKHPSGVVFVNPSSAGQIWDGIVTLMNAQSREGQSREGWTDSISMARTLHAEGWEKLAKAVADAALKQT